MTIIRRRSIAYRSVIFRKPVIVSQTRKNSGASFYY
jgi:hypothetical protein